MVLDTEHLATFIGTPPAECKKIVTGEFWQLCKVSTSILYLICFCFFALILQLRLDYGGGDVTQVFYWLLKKSGFPHPVNLSRKLDAMLLNKLKHEFCHVNLVSIFFAHGLFDQARGNKFGVGENFGKDASFTC